MRTSEQWRRTGLGAISLALILSAPGAFSQPRPEWRSWTAADGMPESYIRSIAAGPDGHIWARHGTVDFMSVLDGYGIVKVPEFRTGLIEGFGTRARAYAGASGDAWAVEGSELLRLISGKWVIEVPIHGSDHLGSDPMLAAVPDGGHRVLVLFADRLAAYYPKQRTWSVVKRARDTRLGEFLHMVPGFREDFWITGARGVARFQSGGEQAAGRWTEGDTRRIGLRDTGYPQPASGEELFFAGRIGIGSRWAVARWKDSELEIVYRSEQDNVRGWRGPDGEIWVLDGASLFRETAGQWRPVQRRGALLGTVNDVLTERDGGFWIGTSEGLTKYCAPVWRAPTPIADMEGPVHSIAEDRQGRLWFAATEYLLELDGSVWRRHRLPSGMRTQTTRTRSTLALSDGRITVKVGGGDIRESMVIFDPRTQRFEFLRHPKGLTIGLMVPRGDGTFWVTTKPGYGIEIWDGKTFRPQFAVPSSWKGDDVRSLLESRNGTLWIGGAGAAGTWRNGVFNPLRQEDGFTETGGFDLVEPQSGQILAGGRDKLMQFDGRRWSVLKSGLDRVRTIAKTRDGTLWVASGTGLHRYRNGDWIGNGEEDGLASNAIYSVFEDSQGRIWAGSSLGLRLYHPEADRDAPRVGFAPAGNMKVAGPDGDFRIFFFGLDKWNGTLADRLLFSFRLDTGAWSPFAAASSATLHGLDPGRHRIHLRGMDRNGNMQQAPDSFEFAVVLPWYRQGGFLAVMIGAGLAIAILFGVAIANYRQRGLLIVELDKARLAAESASRQKSQFLANMSHEIRTPMNAVVGMTGLALDMAQNDEQKDYLSTVQVAANSLLGILNDILDFSKVEAGKLELETVDFDLEKSIQHVLRTLSLRAQEKGLTLALRMSESVPVFLAGDPHRLQQILLNLVGNAIKFTTAGEVRLEARVHSGDDRRVASRVSPLTLEFVVMDTGIGVGPGKQQAIFAPFEQADSSTTRKYGGTGLGLAICAKLVEMMQGKIWIESPWQHPESGRRVAGSAFHFTARFLPGKAPVPELPRSAGPAPRGLRILLADDNPVNRKLAVLMLERRGHTVMVAGNGREAIEILKREGAGIVFMDIQMPEMDGFEATAAIRESEKGTGRHLPIVALTAHAMRGDSERCLAQGMDAYLAKPIRPDDLDRVLSEVFNVGQPILAASRLSGGMAPADA